MKQDAIVDSKLTRIFFIFYFQMSAGLMSCVRENSPPLENSMHGGGGNGSDTGGFTSEPGNYETLFKFDDSKPM